MIVGTALYVLNAVSAHVTQDNAPLASALHAITKNCVSRESYNECSAFAMGVSSACSPGDVKCHAKQLAQTYEYCEGICGTATHAANEVPEFLAVYEKADLSKRSDTHDEDDEIFTPKFDNSDAGENAALNDNLFGNDAQNLSQFTHNVKLNETAVSSSKSAHTYADKLEEHLAEAVAKLRQDIHVGLNGVTLKSGNHEDNALIRSKDPQKGIYLEPPEDIAVSDGQSDALPSSGSTIENSTVTSGSYYTMNKGYPNDTRHKSDLDRMRSLTSPLLSTTTSAVREAYSTLVSDTEFVTLYRDESPDCTSDEKESNGYSKRLRNHLNIHAAITPANSVPSSTQETSSTKITSSSRFTGTTSSPTGSFIIGTSTEKSAPTNSPNSISQHNQAHRSRGSSAVPGFGLFSIMALAF